MDSTLVELAEFNQWLHRGLGRAVVYLKTHDPKPYREAVLYACTHGLTYDAQCEEGREAFLLDLIRCIGDDEFFRGGLSTVHPIRDFTTRPQAASSPYRGVYTDGARTSDPQRRFRMVNLS